MAKNFKKIVLTALCAFALCVGVAAFSAVKYPAYATGVLKAGLNVGKDISLVVYADVENGENVTATFEWEGGEKYADAVVGEKQGETNTYKFAYKGLSAQYMAKEVTVTVKSGETTVASESTSIKAMLENYIASSAKEMKINANANKKLNTLCADILNYGKAAEAYLGMTDDIGTVTGGTTFAADETAETTTEGDLKWNAGVIFDYNVQPAAKVYIPNYKDTLVAKFNDEEIALETTEKENVYLVKYADYDILKVAENYTFAIFDGENKLGSLTTSFVALANKGNADIVKAAYVYGTSAVKYDFVLEDINFVSEHFQAESVITNLESNNKKAGATGWQYAAADGTITTGSGTIANGAEGNFVENLSYNGTNLSSARWTIAMTVNAPKAGEYELRGMMQINNNVPLKNKLKVAVKQNGEEVADGDYVVSATADNCFPASQWGGSYSGGWKNIYGRIFISGPTQV